MKVLELFAGVGGFRIGLENSDKDFFKTKWANQWEPSRKSQDAFEVYDYHFPDSENLNISISDISDEKFASMDADMIVGGFPCQDYSVARSKKVLKGKKVFSFGKSFGQLKISNLNTSFSRTWIDFLKLLLNNVGEILQSCLRHSII